MKAGQAEKTSAPKKPYIKPVLKKFGSVAELTRGVNGSQPDAGLNTTDKLGFG